MRALVVYSSSSGVTGDIAAWITDELQQAGWSAELSEATAMLSPEPFDLVLIGSGIHAGHWLHSAVDWLDEYAEELRAKPLATFTSSLGIASGDPDAVESIYAETAATLAPLRLTTLSHGAFLGAYDPTKVKFSERLIMRAMHQDPCDLRDEAVVRSWVRSVVAQIAAPVTA
ncbi:MAG: flavodoxin domain-containing protein [Propionibacteriaceae bacterium]